MFTKYSICSNLSEKSHKMYVIVSAITKITLLIGTYDQLISSETSMYNVINNLKYFLYFEIKKNIKLN